MMACGYMHVSSIVVSEVNLSPYWVCIIGFIHLLYASLGRQRAQEFYCCFLITLIHIPDPSFLLTFFSVLSPEHTAATNANYYL